MWIVFTYVVLSGALAISAGANAGTMVGVAFAAGSVLAVAVGGGLRASLLGPAMQKVWGSVIAALLLVLGLWVGTHFSATFFGVYVSGPIWVVIGAVVCFLFVDKKTLFGSRQSAASDDADHVQKVIRAYGNALASRKTVLSDASELPYPKPVIKAALITAIGIAEDVQVRDQLKTAFVSLADWQNGVGPVPHEFDLALQDKDPMSSARKMAAVGPAYRALAAKVIAEMQGLITELKSQGL